MKTTQAMPSMSSMPLMQVMELDEAMTWLTDKASVTTGTPPVTLQANHQALKPGDVFVAWKGETHDARLHVPDALARGALACLIDASSESSFQQMALPAWWTALNAEQQSRVIAVHGLKKRGGLLADACYQHPSQHLQIAAVTGTNGKTSVSFWLAHALQALQAPCQVGLVGTLGHGTDLAHLHNQGLTTPMALDLQALWREWQAKNVRFVAMEASSIGLAEGRLVGTHVDTAILTNFTQDHLDYHGDMATYWSAKRSLFRQPGLQRAVIHQDDPQGAALIPLLEAQGGIDVWSVSRQNQLGRVWAEEVSSASDQASLQAVIHEAGQAQTWFIHLPVIGAHHLDNLLCVWATLRSWGFESEAVAQACAHLPPVPGRMQRVLPPSPQTGSLLVCVDYAHTPDALEKTLQALQPIAKTRKGRLIVVFGCGGNRDASKRPLMGQIAAREADTVYLTSDNPRHEDPQALITAIQQGIPSQTQTQDQPQAQIHIQIDRAQAIAQAILEAKPADVVLLAGKGHEKTQVIGQQVLPFSDVDQAQQALGLRELLDRLGSRESNGIIRVHTDSRSVQKGDLFMALEGEHFNGHDFVEAAIQAGAAAVCVSRPITTLVSASVLASILAKVTVVQVADTLAALGMLAAAWRRRHPIPLVAVTGSNGKTTVTQMLRSILETHRPGEVLATQGNFNNAIGLPLTLLRLRVHHTLAVVEIGMNHPGEIAPLARMAAPTVALVNNAQREHQEFMVSVEEVARENAQVFRALGPQGIAVFPGFAVLNPICEQIFEEASQGHAAVWRFRYFPRLRREDRWAADLNTLPDGEIWGWRAGDEDEDADADADSSSVSSDETLGTQMLQLQTSTEFVTVKLTLQGEHHAQNAVAATTCALALGILLETIAEGLSRFKPVSGRCESHQLARPGQKALMLVDDTYNANPDSVRAAIDLLATLPSPRALVLGDMAEVGEQGPAFHAEVGQYAAEKGIEALYGLGPLTQASVEAFIQTWAHQDPATQTAPTNSPLHGHHPQKSDWPALVSQLQKNLSRNAIKPLNSLLIKGSRAMQMERVVQELIHELQERTPC
jgi:murE/murF fusion protein